MRLVGVEVWMALGDDDGGWLWLVVVVVAWAVEWAAALMPAAVASVAE